MIWLLIVIVILLGIIAEGVNPEGLHDAIFLAIALAVLIVIGWATWVGLNLGYRKLYKPETKQDVFDQIAPDH